MSDDILDNMSLSDDEMLDDLAGEMLMEMAERDSTQPALSSNSTVPASWAHGTVVTSNNVANPPRMPDLSQMMSQMMPMVSQMFSGNGGSDTLLGCNANSYQQAPVSWQELVKRHVPENEQEDWLRSIDADIIKLRLASTNKTLFKPHSCSYRTKSLMMPSVYMAVETMLATMLSEAVRSANLEHVCRWQELRNMLVSELAQTNMTKVFEAKFKDMLWKRVASDPDYLLEKDCKRYRNIRKTFSAVKS